MQVAKKRPVLFCRCHIYPNDFYCVILNVRLLMCGSIRASVLLLVQYLYRTDGVAERCGPEASKETGYCALLKATTGHFLSLSFAFAASPSCQVPGKTRMDPGRAIVPFILKGKKKKKNRCRESIKTRFLLLFIVLIVRSPFSWF